MVVEENGLLSREQRDARPETTLRPRQIEDYVGQDQVKNILQISLGAALNRGEPLDHTLLYGPPGLGKTTLANILANEMGVHIKVTSGPAIERAGDMVAILTQLSEGTILFIDEVHRLNRVCEEVLYPAMEDYFVSWVVDKGLKARSMNLSIKPFTLVGATTRFGMLSSPLRDRFGNICKLDFYTDSALAVVIKRSAKVMDIPCDEDGVWQIASRSRGTPRIANRLLRRVRDYAEIVGDGIITEDIACRALSELQVDDKGLDSTDRRVMLSIIKNYGGGPVGLNTLSASIGEDPQTIEDVHEPYLLQKGFLNKTPRGRVVTPAGYRHLGINPVTT